MNIDLMISIEYV